MRISDKESRDERDALIVEEYAEGLSLRRLASRFNLSHEGVSLVLDKYKVRKRPGGIVSILTKKLLRAYSSSGLTIKETAEQLDVWPTTVYIKARIFNLKFKSPVRSYKVGADHPAWKGGRMLYKGYIYEAIPQGHPKRTRTRRYLPLHTLLMEQKIGRPLRKHEQVRHLNKEKMDNRLENLTLVNTHPRRKKS